MKYYLVTHTHRHGASTYHFKTQGEVPDLEVMAEKLAIDYEPDAEEDLDYYEVKLDEIVEI